MTWKMAHCMNFGNYANKQYFRYVQICSFVITFQLVPDKYDGMVAGFEMTLQMPLPWNESSSQASGLAPTRSVQNSIRI
jgi:hypothetical protein